MHLREPGQEDRETIATGAASAVAGGFSAICAMPNTDPVIDNQSAVGFVKKLPTLATLERLQFEKWAVLLSVTAITASA